MTAPTFRRVFLAALTLPLLALGGCSTTGPAREQPQVLHPAEAVAAKTLEADDPPAVAMSEHLQRKSSAPARRARGRRDPAQHEDLFDRIRAGYQLGEVDQPAVDQQLAWYLSHPQYLERSFTRGQRYLYHIVTELEARQMPLELALLPVVESAFEPFGYSRAHASGLWQFIASTGRRFGLKQNWWYDGRRDVVASTRAALDYLQFLHQEFGDWLLAVAAYNCGEMNVRRAIQRNLADNDPTDFWHLKLPRETRAYVPKLVAMSRLVADPAAHGITLAAIPNVPFFGTVATHGQIDLKMAAELADITHEEITYLNPGFNRWATDPDGPHELLLPVESCELFTENLARVPNAERIQLARYEVRRGDTLSSIAARHGTSVPALMQLNGLSSTRIHPGDGLLLPGGGTLHPKVALAAQRHDRSSVARGGGKRYHVVRSGETLWSIARRYGLKMHTLASLNGLRTNDILPVGRRLVLRGG